MTYLGWIALVLAVGPPGAGAGENAVHLYVRSMAAPRPALKYQLLPELGELKPGNAAQEYLKCFAEQRPYFYSKKAVADRARFRKMPLLELRLEAFPELGGGPARRADWAARMEMLDWQALGPIRDGGADGLPAELGPLQLLAESIQIRFRAHVARQQFDDAIRSAKTILTLSRHLGEHPTELAGALGLSVAHLGLDGLEEMVQQPGCPNLYWALTDLPSPLVDLHKAVQGERIRVAADLRPFRADAPMTESELETFTSRLSGLLSLARSRAGLPPRSVRLLLRKKAADQATIAAARRRLVEAGSKPELVDRFPPVQIILLDEMREFELRRDERMKLLALPLWQIDGLAHKEDREPPRDGLLGDLLPQIVKLRREQAAIERQVALLRHVEALRMYAAAHGGAPARLSDVPVPLPDDPFTGRPFAYAIEGERAHLRGGPTRAEGPDARSDVHYVITLLE